MAEETRQLVHIRLPKSLIRALDIAVTKRRKQLGTDKWSRNDEVVARLKEALRG